MTDDIDRACRKALHERKAAYRLLKRYPSDETRAAYDRAVAAWRDAAAKQVTHGKPWRIRPRRGPAAVVKALSTLVHPNH